MAESKHTPGPYAELSDADLERQYNSEIRYHDNLIDSADMGDERIYFSGKAINAMRAEKSRRAAIAKAEGRS